MLESTDAIGLPKQALQKIKIELPLVIRFVEKGDKILKESKIDYIAASTLEDAANKALQPLNNKSTLN